MYEIGFVISVAVTTFIIGGFFGAGWVVVNILGTREEEK